MSRVPFALLNCLLLLLLAPSARGFAQASAAPGKPQHAALLPLRLDAHASLTWEAGFGVGARADIPVFDTGSLYGAHDDLAVSLGVDAAFITFGGSDVLYVWPTATVQWSLGLNERVVFYPELGLAGRIKEGTWAGIYPNIGFGLRYSLYRSIALFGRLGWPIGVSAGLTF
jgi:hypothetical protein